MKCPYCSAFETKVIESRLNQNMEVMRRRRECQECRGRFTTYERVEEIMPAIIKKDGRREPYNRNKVRSGVEIACQKREISSDLIESMITNMEKKVQSIGMKEIPARTIGKMLLSQLFNVDKVAFIRFGSVYWDFQNVEDFISELRYNHEVPKSDSTLSFPFAIAEESSTSSGKTPRKKRRIKVKEKDL